MKLLDLIKALCIKVLRLFAPKPAVLKEEKWNPLKWQGTKWVTLQATSTGLYASVWYEIDRNKEGRVTLIPPYGWDNEKHTIRNRGHWTTQDKKLSELLTEEQASYMLLSHPANVIMAAKPRKDQ